MPLSRRCVQWDFPSVDDAVTSYVELDGGTSTQTWREAVYLIVVAAAVTLLFLL